MSLPSLSDRLNYVLPSICKSDDKSAFMSSSGLQEFMEADLAKSGLTPEMLNSYIPAVPPNGKAGYMIPYFSLDGRGVLRELQGPTMWRCRMLKPEKGQKYTQPSAQELARYDLPTAIPYIHPQAHVYMREKRELVICEGEKKAASVVHFLELGAVGIGGCWAWQCNRSKKLHPWLETLIREYEIERVTIIPDGDIARWDILKAYGPLGVDLRDRVKVDFDFVALPDVDDKIDDLLVSWGDEREERWNSLGRSKADRMVEDPARLVVEYGLSYDTNKEGTKVNIHLNESNIAILLEEHPRFPELWYNEDCDKPMYGAQRLEETDSAEILMFMQRFFQFPKLNLRVVESALNTVMMRRRRSPFLLGWQEVEWDGVDRRDWPIRLWGVGGEHAEMFCDHMMRWMVGLYARLVSPGCEMGFMLCLTGPQEIGKSGFAEVVSDDLHVPMVGDHKGKDVKMMIHHGVIVLLDEMDALYSADATFWKSMITNKKDPWRPPYGRLITDKARRSVLLGTSNAGSFLYNDPTGQRRFAVVAVDRLLDFAAFKGELGQIRAQARVMYERGEIEYWRTTDEMRAYVTAEHQAEDVGEQAIRGYICSTLHMRPERLYGTDELGSAGGMVSRGRGANLLTELLKHTLGLLRVNHSGRVRWKVPDDWQADGGPIERF